MRQNSLRKNKSNFLQSSIKDLTTMFKTIIFILLGVFAYSDTAIVTYHMYKKTDLLTTVACSDGANGIMSWGYRDLSQMFPYVTAWQSLNWNSPQCGSCIRISYQGKYIYVTAIDKCGIINSAYSHFDMSMQSFTLLFGQLGIAKGTMTANFTIVASKFCQGNKKAPIGDIYPHLQENTVKGYENVQTIELTQTDDQRQNIQQNDQQNIREDIQQTNQPDPQHLPYWQYHDQRN